MARELAAKIYSLCRREPLSRDPGLTDQLRRAGVSVMNNLADGWESTHIAQKRLAYGYARRSCGEIRSMSYLLLDNQSLTPEEHQSLKDHCIRTGRLISGLIRSLTKNH